MDLENFKNIWQEENKRLEERIRVNEELLRKMNLDKAVKKVDWLILTAIIGRNLALVYCLISLFYAFRDITAWEYSVPALLGAAAMLASFISHLKIKRISYYKIPVVELQKQIAHFRIHTAAHARYDALIVIFWFATLLPSTMKYNRHFDFYHDSTAVELYLISLAATVIFCLVLKKYAYNDFDRRLRESESVLEKISAFEKP